MNRFFRLLLVLGLIFSSLPIWADENSLNKLIDETLKNNPEIAAMKLDYQAKDLETSSVMQLMDPMFTYESMNLPLQVPEMGAGTSPMRENKFSLSQTLPFPGKIGAEVDMKKSAVKTALAQYNKSIEEMKKELRLMYYRIVHMDNVLKLFQQKKEQLNIFLKLMQARYQAGRANSSEYLRMQLMVSMTEREILSMQAERKNMLESLGRMIVNKQLLNDTTFDYGPVPAINELNTDALLAQARSTFVDVRLKQAMEETAAKELNAANWSWAPDIDLGLSLSLAEDGGSTWSFMIGVTLPIFPFARQLPAIASADAMKNSNSKQLEDAINRLEENINISAVLLKQDNQILQLIQGNSLQDAKQSLEIAFKEYLVEKVSFEDVFNQIIQLFDLHLEKENIVYDMYKNIQNLRYYTNDQFMPVKEGR